MNGFHMTSTNLVMKLVNIRVQVCLFLFAQALLTKSKFLFKPVMTTTSLVMKQVKVKLFVQVCLFLSVQVVCLNYARTLAY